MFPVSVISHQDYFHGSCVSPPFTSPLSEHSHETNLPLVLQFSLSCLEISGACSYLLCRAYSPLFPDCRPSPAPSVGTSHPCCQFLPNAQPCFSHVSFALEDINQMRACLGSPSSHPCKTSFLLSQSSYPSNRLDESPGNYRVGEQGAEPSQRVPYCVISFIKHFEMTKFFLFLF